MFVIMLGFIHLHALGARRGPEMAAQEQYTSCPREGGVLKTALISQGDFPKIAPYFKVVQRAPENGL